MRLQVRKNQCVADGPGLGHMPLILWCADFSYGTSIGVKSPRNGKRGNWRHHTGSNEFSDSLLAECSRVLPPRIEFPVL